MSYIDAFIKKVQDETNRQIEKAEQHRVLEPVMDDLQELWSSFKFDDTKVSDITVAFSFLSVGCCCVNFYLTPQEGLKTVRIETILTFMLSHSKFTFDQQHSYDEMKWIAWSFKHENGSRLMLRFWLEESKSCKWLPTGNKIDELKLVCEDSI